MLPNDKGVNRIAMPWCGGASFVVVLLASSLIFGVASRTVVTVDITVSPSSVAGGLSLIDCLDPTMASCSGGLAGSYAVARRRHRSSADDLQRQSPASANRSYFAAFIPVLDLYSILVAIHPMGLGVASLAYDAMQLPVVVPPYPTVLTDLVDTHPGPRRVARSRSRLLFSHHALDTTSRFFGHTQPYFFASPQVVVLHCTTDQFLGAIDPVVAVDVLLTELHTDYTATYAAAEGNQTSDATARLANINNRTAAVGFLLTSVVMVMKLPWEVVRGLAAVSYPPTVVWCIDTPALNAPREIFTARRTTIGSTTFVLQEPSFDDNLFLRLQLESDVDPLAGNVFYQDDGAEASRQSKSCLSEVPTSPCANFTNVLGSDGSVPETPLISAVMPTVPIPFVMIMPRSPRISNNTNVAAAPRFSLLNVSTAVESLYDDVARSPQVRDSTYFKHATAVAVLLAQAAASDPVIGVSLGPMPSSKSSESDRLCWVEESPLSSFFVDSLVWKSNADFGFMNACGATSAGWPVGPVDLSQIYNAFPFDYFTFYTNRFY